MKPFWIQTGLVVLSLLLAASHLVHAQYGKFSVPPPLPGNGPIRVKKTVDRYPQQPSVQPAYTIPTGPLGFSVPGSTYLLRKQSLVSLDFLDEERILFTFRISSAGLISRDADGETFPRQIQALVLSLPTGKIETRATWTVPDGSRYLWMLEGGQFLLRVPEGLDQGDSQLKMKPSVRLPGRLLWIEMDPSQRILMTNSLEHAVAASEHSGPNAPGNDPSASKADGDVLVVRTTNRETGETIHVSRVPWTHQTADWPMNNSGYVERLQDKDKRWVLKFSPHYPGKSWLMAGVESACPQQFSFLSEDELLATVCAPEGGWNLLAVTTWGKLLWKQKLSWNSMWPLLVMSQDGSRVARQTLLLKRTIDHYKMVGADDLQGQVVRVFDSKDGKTVLESPLTPVFDNGGNVAISPSGKRVAILNSSSIQVFQLPVPSPLLKRELLPKPSGAAAASAPPAP
jgi:hypothetical protein